MNDATLIPKLQKLCRSWGGKLTAISAEKLQAKAWLAANSVVIMDFSPCPFNNFLAVDWGGKEIFYVKDEVNFTEIIHEMGHLFACRVRPDVSDETTFWGWEYTVAMMIGATEAEWFQGNHDYIIGTSGHSVKEVIEGRAFRRVTFEKKSIHQYVEESVAVSVAAGLIVDGNPYAVR